MLAVAGLFLAACGQEDNEFAGLKTANAEDAVVVPGFSAAGLGVIDLNTVEVSEALDVQAFTVSEAALPDGVELAKGEIVFEDGTVIPTTASGQVSGKELSAYIASLYGRRPVERTVVGHVYLYAVQNGAAVKIDAGEVTFVVVPKAPVIEEAYYLTGTLNGWDNTNTDFVLSNGGQDPYENPTFTCTIDLEALGYPESIQFKATPVSGVGGDWSGCLAAAEEEGKFNYDNNGGNFEITGIESGVKMLILTFNMLDQTWNWKAFNPFIYFIGATDGWTAAEQRICTENYDNKYTGYVYLADPNGWGLEFKWQREPGNWDSQLNSGSFTGGITGDFADWGGNIKATADEGLYYVEMDLDAMTLKGTKINSMGLVGAFNGWNPADATTKMTWDADNYCYTIQLNTPLEGEWKFAANDGWDINLGGSIDQLIAGGANLTASGNVISLYPTRRDYDNIYCKVGTMY